MTTPTIIARTALALAAAAAPLAAQTPFFADGSAFGGSRVFSEGLNPLGNPARFDQSPSGWYLTYLDGDQRAKDNQSILQDTQSTDPAAVTAALGRLKDAPWAMRERAYGIAGIKDGMNFGYTREEFHSALADTVDLLNVNSALANNTTTLDGRKAVVNRIHFGAGTLASGTAAGCSVRLEKWEMGTVAAPLSRNPGVFPAPLGTFPFPYSADAYVMGYPATTMKTLTAALDVGFTTQIAEGLHVGAMVDQLNAKRLWDVDLKPQYRGALQVDLGPNTHLTVEGDFNAVERMPIAIKQKTTAASLRYQVSPSVIVLLGGEQKKLGDAATTRFGATLQLRTPTFLMSLGFQAGQDRPLKGLSLMVN
jgi:hypothetical protein